MTTEDLKLLNLGINKEWFGKIYTFVDYGNVNYWFEKDRKNFDEEKSELPEYQKLIIDIEKLARFLNLFSEQKRFYYGWNQRRKNSWHITIKAENNGFIKITKPIKFIKHYLDDEAGKYVEISKSNFDVEISVDSIRLMKEYDTFCLLSGDSDFASLARYLKKNKKKVIIVASGQVFHTLKDLADLYINAQQIKFDICGLKETTPQLGRGLDIGSASGGQDNLAS